MAEGQVRIRGNTEEAQRALDKLKRDLAETGKSASEAGRGFSSLEKELGVGSRQMSLVDQSLQGVASQLGVSTQGTRGLSTAFKTLTGNISSANIAVGAASLAFTAIAAGIAHSVRAHREWIDSVIDGHRRIVDYTAALQRIESDGFAAMIAGATEAERVELRLGRARDLASRQAVGSIENIDQARQQAQEQLEAQLRGEAAVRQRQLQLQRDLQNANAFTRGGIELEIAQTERQIATSRQNQAETRELISILGDLRREREGLLETTDKLVEAEEKLAEAMRAQAIAASSRAKEERDRRAAEARRAAARAAQQRAEAEAERERLRILREVQRAEEEGARLIQRLTAQTLRVRESGLEEFENLRQRFMSDEERRIELLQRLELDSFKQSVDTQTELTQILEELAYTYDENRRNELLQRAEDLREFSAIQLEIERERNEAIEEEDRRHKEFLIREEEDLQRTRDRLEAERLAKIKMTQNAIASFTTSSLSSMVGVYAGASKEMAKQRRQALGDGLMAEGLSNIISAPVRFWTQGPQAAAISASTGAAQVAFGKTLGGTLGYRGGGGSGEAQPNAPTATNQTQINETSNVNLNVGFMGGDRREVGRDLARLAEDAKRRGN